MRKHILLIYPQQGFSGVFVEHAPISLLYAATELVKSGYEVEIWDTRLAGRDWKPLLAKKLRADTLLAGISVMSGKPILHSIELSREIKALRPDVSVVWGGPHATFAKESIAMEASVDFAISGYGSQSLKLLADQLVSRQLKLAVPGLSYRPEPGEWLSLPEKKEFERIPFREIPYDLISDYSVYGQLERDKVIFSMYSVLGCPYKCSFCSSPAQYRGIPGKVWSPLETTEVVDHIAYVHDRFGADYIYFIDDDSFVSLGHVEAIIDEISQRQIPVKLGFRGARINEIKKMSHAYLEKLAKAGTDMIHVGVESGSDRILRLIRKNCTVADILECNRKLAQHPEIRVGYNFMMGIPSETLAELKLTRDLWFQLLSDHPNIILFQPNKFRPLPGTELFALCERDWGYVSPKTLQQWADIEVEGDFVMPWYPPGMKAFCDLMLVSSYFVDRKIEKVTSGKTWFYRCLRGMSRLYRPVAEVRLRRGWSRLLVEYRLYVLAMALIGRARGGKFGLRAFLLFLSNIGGVILLPQKFARCIRRLFPSRAAASH